MFAKPKSRDSQTEKGKMLTSNSPQRMTTQRKNQMATSVRYTDYSGNAGLGGGYLTCGSGGFDSPNFYQNYQTMTSPQHEKRLEKLEDRISLLSSQYDQFIPLISLLDSANAINRADQSIKKITKKQLESDEKLSSFQIQLNSIMKSVDIIKMQYINNANNYSNNNNSNNNITINNNSNQFSENQSKYMNQSIKKEKSNNISQSNIIADHEHQINQLIKTQSLKLQDNLSHNLKDLKEEIYQKIHVQNRSLEDFRNQFSHESQGIHQTLANISNNYSTMMNTGKMNESVQPQQQLQQDIYKQIEQKMQEQINLLRMECSNQFLNLSTDIGVVQVYQQMNAEGRRKEKLSNQLSLPDNLDKFERLLKINNVEQAIFIEEIDHFNKENCQRLINELRNLEERIEGKRERLQLSLNRYDQAEIDNLKKEIEMMFEQIHSYKIQIDGTRKISVTELKRIEDKMEQIDSIRSKISNDPNEKKDLQRITQDIKKAISFQEKISKLVEQIDENLKIVNEYQQKVDEKLELLQSDIYQRS